MKYALLTVTLLLGCSAAQAAGRDKASVLAVDESQRAMVAAADVAGLDRLAHPNLRINAPGGTVLTRARFLANMRSGEIKSEAFERTAEDVTISGNTAVVMGREVFTPTAASELGRLYGAKPLQRRYTNVYVLEHDRWRWLARQANVVMPPAKPAPAN
jgi:hypothetical protein